MTIDEIRSDDGCNTKVELDNGRVWIAGHWFTIKGAEAVAMAIHRAVALNWYEPTIDMLRKDRDQYKSAYQKLGGK